jgi:hypothetical protein
MLTHRNAWIVFFAAALLAAGAQAQPAAGTVKGVLTDNSGGVIPAAVVTLFGGGAQKATQTQADGSYVFGGLAPGQYTVCFAYPGLSVVERVVTLSAGATAQVPLSCRWRRKRRRFK